jgi:exopolysaccharide biosynthesis polyprenyl glycosylphosphotransferase
MSIILWLCDLSAAWTALWIADSLRHRLPWGAFPDKIYLTWNVLIIVSAIWSAVFYAWGTYERRHREGLTDELRTVAFATTFALFTLASFFYFLKIEDFSRVLFAYFYALDLVFGLGLRLAVRAVHSRFRPANADLRRALIVGTDSVALDLAAQIRGWVGYTVVGFLTENGPTVDSASPVEGMPIVGSFHDVSPVLARYSVDEVFLSPVAKSRIGLADLMLNLLDSHVRVRMMPDLLEFVAVRTGIETLRGLPVITVREPAITGVNSFLKRGLDILGSIVGLIVFVPLMLAIVILIRLDSPGPILFVQERAGRYGKSFRMFKFRSMVANAEEMLSDLVDVDRLEQPAFKLPADPRVTRVGRWLRRWSLDELPQLVNVLKGEMSLVGPRPEEMRIVEKYSPWQRQRLLVKPGLTGSMQISGRGNLSFDERIKLELAYIENYSLWRDIVILLETLPAVVSRKGAF